MLLLEQVTGGGCFEGVNEQVFLIHVLTRGVTLPLEIEPSVALLLRGLLTPDRRERWQWKEVRDWLDGKSPVASAGPVTEGELDRGPAILLAGRVYRKATAFALAAAEATNWDEASDLLQRGTLATWVAEASLGSEVEAGVRLIQHLSDVPDDLRLALA